MGNCNNFGTQGCNEELFNEMMCATSDKELEDIAKDFVDSPSEIDECIRQYRSWAQAKQY